MDTIIEIYANIKLGKQNIIIKDKLNERSSYIIEDIDRIKVGTDKAW